MLVALHFSEERQIFRLLAHAQPGWLLLAGVLQAGTYLAQGEIWRSVAQAANTPIRLASAYKLSLAKLFVDQALPSAGISGTVVFANSLERQGVPTRAVMASVVVNTASYYISYVVSLAAAVSIAAAHGHGTPLIILPASFFAVFGVAMSFAVLWLPTRQGGVFKKAFFRVPHGQKLIQLLRAADSHLSRSPKLLLWAVVLQLVIVVLDASTLWMLLQSLAAESSPARVFSSFMLSTLFRTLGVVPGGLGTFEAASILTLKVAGVPTSAALSSTLLFRGLSFWLPMLPGLIFSREAQRALPSAQRPRLEAYWSLDSKDLLQRLQSSDRGLSSAEAQKRLLEYGPNELREQRPLSRIWVLWNQVKSPLLLLLVFAASASAITGAWADACIVLTIVAASVGIGYSREYRAQQAAAKLRARIRSQAKVLRDGQPTSIPVRDLVPGDVVLLSAGNLVPADAVILQATDFFVNEAVLTGESFPVQKVEGATSQDAGIRDRLNCALLGTNVRSGSAQCVVVETGRATQFGAIAHRLTLRPPETEFDRGILHFGYLLTASMLIMVLLVFAANMLLGRPAVETLLFSIALAVGLSPELLPAILSINLARGAQMMARHGVLVRKLNSIENLGSMDVLCTDKTGTLTEGVVRLEGAYDAAGDLSATVLEMAAYNAVLQAGVSNPLDQAILQAWSPDLSRAEKLAEIPYDFVRKRVSVVWRDSTGIHLLTKGAFEHVLEICDRSSDGSPLDSTRRAELDTRFRKWSAQGTRVLAVAAREMPEQTSFARTDERQLTFLGFLTFLDRPKEGVREALQDLSALGVSVKLITGDVRLVAQHVASAVGMRTDRVLTGKELDELRDEALWHAAENTDLFVEVDPNQKERIILSLKKKRHVVGFLGDGINDAPAMHAADTSLSVDQAVDVARETADFVLLERHLDVIRRGIQEGRRTFANTLKYVLMTSSANLGNMVSMAVASMFLPFLPLLAGQILLNNFLSDIPAIGLADDNVDPELVGKPRRWNMRFIARFMVEFGVLSSLFDFLTFGVLLGLFLAGEELFRTGWFVESLLTELVIALVVRTRRPFYRSRPGSLLLNSTMALIALTLAIPFLPYAHVLGFTPLPFGVFVALGGIIALYVLATELAKTRFYQRGW